MGIRWSWSAPAELGPSPSAPDRHRPARITYPGTAPSRRFRLFTSRLENCESVRFCILRDALRWSAPQDEVPYVKDLPHPEEARRAVSKGVDTVNPHFPPLLRGRRSTNFLKYLGYEGRYCRMAIELPKSSADLLPAASAPCARPRLTAIMPVAWPREGATMSAVLDRPPGLVPTIGGSTYVKPSEMNWQPTRFEKVSIKVLYEDPERGEMTCLLKAGTRRLHPLSQAPSSWRAASRITTGWRRPEIMSGASRVRCTTTGRLAARCCSRCTASRTCITTRRKKLPVFEPARLRGVGNPRPLAQPIAVSPRLTLDSKRAQRSRLPGLVALRREQS